MPSESKLLEAAKPLIEYINEFHPHHTIIVSHTWVELLEGKESCITKEFLKD